MTRAAKITYAAAAVAVAGLVALAVVPIIGVTTESPAVSERVTASAATPTVHSTQDLAAAHTRGGELYDAYVSEGRLLMPPGYAWPTGAEWSVTPAEAQRFAWYDWIAAHAYAARSGDRQAAIDLKTHIRDVPLEGDVREDVVGLAQGGADGYDALLEMYPLPAGMRYGTFRADRGPVEYARGTAELTAGGLLRSYTVAPGDALWAIAQRFTVRINDLKSNVTIHPGDVIRLD